MAATHTYIVTRATAIQNTATVVGTVDTIPTTGPVAVTIQVSLGDILAINTNGGLSALEAFVAPLMLSAAIKAGLAVPAVATLTQLPTGTFALGGHTFVVSSVTAVGDVATIVGTVDGIAVSIIASASGLSATLAVSLAALEGQVSGMMLVAANKAGLAGTTVTQLPTGTFTL